MQVGATAFVGLLEGTGGISYKVMLKTTFGWVFTLVAVGFMAALLMVLGIRTPNVRNSNSLNAVEQSVVLGGEQAAADLQALCPKSPALEVRLCSYSTNKERERERDVCTLASDHQMAYRFCI